MAPPPPEAPSIAETLTIVDDDADVEETTIATSEETNQAVEIKYVPVAVEEEEPEEQTIFEVVEQMPEFPNGGMAGLMQYLSKNIKYPTIAQENGTQGRVTVQFVVNRDGSIVDAKVLRGVDPYLDKEAIRVISSMPKWKPGMQRGKAVRVKYTVPVIVPLAVILFFLVNIFKYRVKRLLLGSLFSFSAIPNFEILMFTASELLDKINSHISGFAV